MGKNVKIEIDGVRRTYTGVEKIKTNSKRDGTVTWIPEDSFPRADKSVPANGTYKAKKDGLYAYRKFTVNNKNPSLTGKGKDGRHRSYDIDDLGYITSMILPDSIQLIIDTAVFKYYYKEGEIINLTGITVIAMSKNDKWQDVEDSPLIPPQYHGSIVPIDEIDIEPAYAHKLDPLLPWGRIKVIWERPVDAEELTATFQIGITG